MKARDLVRVARQPADLKIRILGEVGYISEIRDGWVLITLLHEDGSLKGCGGVPLDCLDPVTDPAWLAVMAKYDAKLAAQIKASNDFLAKIDAKALELATLHGITPEAVLQIHADITRLHNEYQY